MGEIFIGTEAVASGVVTRHELQRWYRPFYPNVHAPKGRDLSLRDRTVGAWLWSKRNGIVTGVAASALHGAEWMDDDVPVELLWNCTRPPKGIIVRNERVDTDELTWVGEIPVTTPARTAFDIGRYLKRGEAIARLDALMRARPFSIEDVMLLAKRYKGARGVARLKAALPLVDGGAASPQETRLRLLFIDAGLPRPTTQIPVFDEDGEFVRFLDMGWEDFMVGGSMTESNIRPVGRNTSRIFVFGRRLRASAGTSCARSKRISTPTWSIRRGMRWSRGVGGPLRFRRNGVPAAKVRVRACWNTVSAQTN